MIAIVFSILLALYLLGPDLVARWMLGFVVPRKSVMQSRSEEITRAAIWASFPLLIAIVWARASHASMVSGSWAATRLFFAGLYSEAVFRSAQDAWFASAGEVWRWNIALLWRLYTIVVVAAAILILLTANYGAVRRLLPEGWPRRMFARLILPRIAEWHILLSDMLLPRKDLVLHADVLTRSGLYQGVIQDKTLGTDGALRSVTLASPRRFLREAFEHAREANHAVDKEQFWREIPGNLFVIPGAEIANVNLRYTAPTLPRLMQRDALEKALLRELLARIEANESH